MPIATTVADSAPDGSPIEHRTAIAGPGPAGGGSSIRSSIAFINMGHLRWGSWLPDPPPAQPVLPQHHPRPAGKARADAGAGGLLVAFGERAGELVNDAVVLRAQPRLARVGQD